MRVCQQMKFLCFVYFFAGLVGGNADCGLHNCADCLAAPGCGVCDRQDGAIDCLEFSQTTCDGNFTETARDHEECVAACSPSGEEGDCDALFPVRCENADCAECLSNPACGACFDTGVMVCMEQPQTGCDDFKETASDNEECVEVCEKSGDEGTCDAIFPPRLDHCKIQTACADCLSARFCGACFEGDSMSCTMVTESEECAGEFKTASTADECKETCPSEESEICEERFAPAYIAIETCYKCQVIIDQKSS
eukprot:GHVO01068241.1.p1 GENE.GHVO01068241.1~~GHVO01068241.1.p1  ORF type:complete len:252 (+),score=23.34 GHVO01068241.1:853-1608(+)